jgi:hypothetical protein
MTEENEIFESDHEDENIKAAFAEDLPEETPQKEDTKEVPSGYMTKDAWIAAGKDPDEWVSPEVFKERTQRIKETSRLKREIAERERENDNRLRNMALLHRAQLERQKEEILAARDEAIDLSDRDGVKAADKRIKELDKEMALVDDQEVAQVKKPLEVVEWEEENPWINDNDDPRTPIAQKVFAEALSAGKTMAYALRAAEKAVEKAIQDEPRDVRKKPAVSMSDSPRGTVSKNDSPSISWNQLTRDEEEIYNSLLSSSMSKKDYLKAVSDDRRSSK